MAIIKAKKAVHSASGHLHHFNKIKLMDKVKSLLTFKKVDRHLTQETTHLKKLLEQRETFNKWARTY